MTENESERRHHNRIETHLFTVFRRFLGKKEQSLPEVGYTRDISKRGIYFCTSGEVGQGEKVSLAIHTTFDWAEGGDPPKLEGKGKIVRVEPVRKAFPAGDFKGVAVYLERELAVSS